METNPFALLFGDKGKVACEKLLSFHKRFPGLLSQAAIRDMGIFLSHCPEPFLNHRSSLLVSRIFFSLHRLQKKAHSVHAQRIDLNILRIHPAVCGIVVAIAPLRDTEIFNDKHIFKGIQNLIPGTLPLSHSYLTYTTGGVSLYYLEVMKMRGGALSNEELQKLQSDLPAELRKEIEPIDHSLIFPGNEEELFKNIRHLSQEINQSKDLPQAMTSFVEYSQERLKFLVIVLRVLGPNAPPLAALAARLPSLVQFSLETSFCAGMLRKKYPKEATVFTLEISSTLFSRNHHTVNLRSARCYIVKALESMLGPFRDYNGGLLHKENEQLVAIKRALESRGQTAHLLEEWFYNVGPISRRALMTVETGIEIEIALQKMFETPLEPEKNYLLHTRRSQENRLAIIKTTEKNWKGSLPAKALSLIPQIGCSILEREDHLYLCFFHNYASNDILFDVLHQEMTQAPSVLPYPSKTLLRLNFQGGDPSSLNPRLAADIQSHTLSNLLFEGLTRIDRSGKVVPAVAESIDISPCGTVYKFNLRQASWSSGEEVTAYHFEKAWKRTLMTSTAGCPFPDLFFPILNAGQAREKLVPLSHVGIEAQDAKTLQVILETPCPYFLELVSTPPFFPLPGEEEEPTDFNGPFALAQWERGEWIHLSQNPFYHTPQHLKMGGIHISTIRDPYVAYEMFQKGELDFIGDPISPLPPDILKSQEVRERLVKKPVSRIFWIHCNMRTFPLHNRFLRQALSLALNRRQLIETVFIEHTPHFSPLPPRYASVVGNEEGDPEEAMLFFENALKELRLDRSTLPPLTITHSNLSFEKPLIAELQRQWKKALGITVLPQQLPWNDFSAALEKGAFQLGGLYRRDVFNNPLFYLNFFKMSKGNPYRLDNPEYSELLTRFSRGENTPENLQRLETLLCEEMPVIPLVNQSFLALVSPKVKGLEWDENGCLDLQEVTLDETAY
ncbi:peptide ABC transporter substrate-binding protein [Chlamydiota bacterium]